MKILIENQKGFTLIEIMLALVILGMMAISFLAFFGNSLTNIFQIRARKEALALATNKMENIYALQPVDLSINENYEFMEDLLTAENYVVKYDDENDLYKLYAQSHKQGIICIEKNDQGFKVSIEINYRKEKTIKLTSFIRGKEGD